jgi:hypothetical protein
MYEQGLFSNPCAKQTLIAMVNTVNVDRCDDRSRHSGEPSADRSCGLARPES